MRHLHRKNDRTVKIKGWVEQLAKLKFYIRNSLFWYRVSDISYKISNLITYGNSPIADSR